MTENTSTETTAPVAEGTEVEAKQAAQPKNKARTPRTKTGAPAKDEAAPAAKHVVKAGGAKGQRIVELMTEHPEFTRAQLAEAAGATTGRVGETVRWLRDNGSAAEKKIVAAHLKAQEAAKAAKAKEREAAAKAKAAEREAAKKAAAAERPTKATQPTGGKAAAKAAPAKTAKARVRRPAAEKA